MTTYRADWVFTGQGEPIKNGTLVEHNGKIVEIRAGKGDKPDVDLGNALIIPGLVNAHTHLDLGALRGQIPPPAHFTDWLQQVISYRRKSSIEEWEAAIRAGINESLREGTLVLGDISFNGQSYDELKTTQMQFLVFREVMGLSEERFNLAMDISNDWISDHPDVATAGLSPHAPYSVSQSLLTALLHRYPLVPVAMHVAESREELQLLSQLQGPFRDFLQNLGVWHPHQLFRSIDEVVSLLNEFVQSCLIHGNYLTREQWQRLSPSTTVVYCPRTHAYFGHEQHPYLQMLSDGVTVALGTDSLASNPDLSILNECRFLWKRDRSYLNGPTLMKLATHTGKTILAPKTPANFVVIPHENRDSDPWELLWAGASSPSAVYLRGKLQNIF